MAATLPHIQTQHLPSASTGYPLQPYCSNRSSRCTNPLAPNLPPTNLVPNSSYHTLKAAIKKALPNPIPTSSSPRTRKGRSEQVLEHHLRPRSLSFHSPISTSSFSLFSSSSTSSRQRPGLPSSPSSSISGSSVGDNDEIMTERLENEEDDEAISDEDDDDVHMEQSMVLSTEKMERLERARRLLETYGCRC